MSFPLIDEAIHGEPLTIFLMGRVGSQTAVADIKHFIGEDIVPPESVPPAATFTTDNAYVNAGVLGWAFSIDTSVLAPGKYITNAAIYDGATILRKAPHVVFTVIGSVT